MSIIITKELVEPDLEYKSVSGILWRQDNFPLSVEKLCRVANTPLIDKEGADPRVSGSWRACD